MTRELRRVGPDDVEDVADLHLRTVLVAYASIFPEEAPAPTHEDMVRTWEQIVDHGRGWMAEERGRPVGVVGLVPDGTAYEMKAVYVDPRHAGRGIGASLVDRVESVATREQLLPLRLWVLEANDVVRRWYERRGWRLVDDRRTVWGDIDDVRYELAEEGVRRWREA